MTEEIDEKHFEEAEAKIFKGCRKYAEKAGYKLNPDSKVTNTIIKGLAKNKFKHGRAYCPCMMVKGDPAEDKKIICPCYLHKEDIPEKGKCHCGLFVKAD